MRADCDSQILFDAFCRKVADQNALFLDFAVGFVAVHALFFAENEIEWAEVISLIASDPAFQERERCLIILHEANTDEAVIRAHLTSIGDRLPGMMVTGITQIGPLDKDMILFKGAELSVISFETKSERGPELPMQVMHP